MKGSTSNTKKLFMMLIIILLGVSICSIPSKEISAKTYYTSRQVKLPKNSDGTQKLHKIVKISGNTVTYRSLTPVYDEYGWQTEYKEGKKKTAKLNKNTKYYVGSPSKFDFSSGYGWYDSNSKWITKVSKSTFKKKLSKSSSSLRIKSGKVTQIYTRIVLAN